MNLRSIIFLLASSLITSCTLQVSPWDTDPNNYDIPKNLTNKNIEEIINNWNESSKDSLVVILISDSHSKYKDLENTVEEINKVTDADFIFHGCDMTEMGNIQEYKWFYDEMKKLKQPWLTVPGNHDGLNNGISLYKQIFGPDLNNFQLSLNDSLTASFYLVNDNTMELTSSNCSKEDFDQWITNSTINSDNDYKTFMAHVNPWNKVYFTDEDEVYINNVLSDLNFKLFVHGHIHKYFCKDYYNNDLYFLSIDDVEDNNYTRLVYYIENGTVKTKHSRIFY